MLFFYCGLQEHCVHGVEVLPFSSSHGMDDVEVADLNAFLDNMDSEARADLLSGHYCQQHFPQQPLHQHVQWPTGAKF